MFQVKTGLAVAVAVLVTVWASVPALAQEAPSIVEVAGTVTDDSGAAVENAVIEATGTDVSRVLTNKEGRYKFYLVDQKGAFTLTVSREGYVSKTSEPLQPQGKVRFDASLTRGAAQGISIEMTSFVSGVSISGRVTGMDPTNLATHKILIYVLTDRWYIHPFAENAEGRGYASINEDGTWTIGTVNRRNNPFRLAMVLVPADYVPPAAVQPGENSDESLQATIGRDLVAVQIINAPQGL